MSELLALAETAAIIASVAGSAAGTAYWLGRKLTRIENEIKDLKARVGRLEESVQQQGESLAGVERRVGELRERVASLEERVNRLENRVGNVEARLAGVEERLARLEERVGNVEAGVAELRGRVAGVENRLAQLEERVRGVEEGLSSLREDFAEFKARVTARFDRLEERMERMGRAVRSVNELFIDLLGYEGVLRAEAVTFAKSELARVLELAGNPLTKEEKERLKQLLEKDDLTLEEAQELYRIADKLVEEHGDRIEAWKLLWYSRAWIGINWRRMAEQRRKAAQQGG
jgi:chromosome segregation ATPase